MSTPPISEHDQDPLDYKAGHLAIVPSSVGPIEGGIHDHQRSNGQRYRHSHLGYTEPHKHLRDDITSTESVAEAVAHLRKFPVATVSRTTTRRNLGTIEHCDANAKRGTGTGMCNRPLDEHGNCDRAGGHL